MAFEYAPAPESRSIVDLKPSYGLFIDGEFVDPADGGRFKTINPATEEVLAEVAEAGAGRRRPRGRAPPGARTTRSGARCRAADRAKYLFRIARIIQERSRELAVLESLDNGKPIQESRDVDLPLVAAHFFYYAGWADKLEHAGFGADPRPLGVAGQVIPWNFPLLMLAWKIAPALAAGNTVVLKPAETTPLTALLFAEICQQADLPPGVVNIVTGAGETGRALVEHPGVDKVAFTGSTEVGRAIARVGRRHPQEAHPGAGRQGRQHRLRRRADRPGGRGHRQRHLLQPGPRLLRRLPAAGPGVGRRRGAGRRSSGGWRSCGSATRWTRTPTSARSTRPPSWPGSRSCPTSARPRAPSAGRRRASCPTAGFWFAPTIFTGVTQAHRIAREEIFGPVLSVLTFRTPAEAVEKANNTPYGLSAGIWTEKGSRILCDGRPAARRRGLGQHVQQVRPDLAVRRLQGVRLRPRGRPARAGGATSMPESRLAVRKTYKLFIGGAFPRSESGRSYRRAGRRNVALASRKDARDAVRRRPRGRDRVGRRDRVQPGPDPLPGRRDAGGPPRAVRRARRAGRPRWTRRSTAGSGTPAGPTRSPRCTAAPTRSPGRTSTSPRPSRPAWSAWSPRPTRRCSAWSA